MRTKLLAGGCVTFVAACAFLAAQPNNDPVKVRLSLVDHDNGKPLTGLVRVLTEDGKPLFLPGLYERMTGLDKKDRALGWHVLPAAGAEVALPRAKLRFEGLAGLETTLAREEVDLSKTATTAVTWKPRRIFPLADRKLVAGNTHLHLKGKSLDLADEYLQKIPPADQLRVLFISYLERVKDDELYITNRYPIGEVPRLKAAGVLFNNGEEHRHNFKGFGQGYGHVMFLNLKKLVQPVSLGPGITGKGDDDTPLRPGIDSARGQGGFILWCHNSMGFEDVPNVLTGRVDALNIFDGSRGGNFEENYYKYLDIGLRMPISTGTDWFMYDFSRVYAKVDGELTIPRWLDAVKAGRCQATNGPLLSLTVDGKEIGAVVSLERPKTVRIEASAIGRHDFEKLQLVHNGRVVKTAASQGKGPFEAKLAHEVRIEEPGWLAVRIESKTRNELDRVLYAHTSPVYVELAGKKRFDVEAALELLKQVEEGKAIIAAQGQFTGNAAKDRLLTLYDDALKDLRQRIEQRGKQ